MPAICRGDLKDKDLVHCSLPSRKDRSPDVFINMIGVSRKDDNNDPHLLPADDECATHGAPITIGSTRVFANNKGVGRIGDAVTSCTKVATGSPDTFDGSP